MLAFYALVGGRVFCSWVCPVNLVTDLALWLRRRFDLRTTSRLSRSLRYWVLGVVLVLPAVTGVIAWETVNPVSMAHRGLFFGMGWAWAVLAAVFLFDLLVARHGWCGHLCPVGAFYGLIGAKAQVRVVAAQRDRCDDCMDCFNICPEPQVIKPALKGAKDGIGPVILDINCTNCGRCIDVCSMDVFRFGTRLGRGCRVGGRVRGDPRGLMPGSPASRPTHPIEPNPNQEVVENAMNKTIQTATRLLAPSLVLSLTLLAVGPVQAADAGPVVDPQRKDLALDAGSPPRSAARSRWCRAGSDGPTRSSRP